VVEKKVNGLKKSSGAIKKIKVDFAEKVTKKGQKKDKKSDEQKRDKKLTKS
jgi:hypothetical protein